MDTLILHQYAGSPFSEKIRCLLGFLNLPSAQVEIPVIMPRPLLMPLTGGYRRTPVLQIGREIFCDTALISKVLASRSGNTQLYPKHLQAAVEHLAFWADTFLFKVVVSVAFQPKALADNPLFSDEAAASAFMADRAAFSEESAGLQIPLEVALGHFDIWMTTFNRQLEQSRYLFGDHPTIADFSVYHCLWFIAERPALAADLEAFPHALRWLAAMKQWGHGQTQTMSGNEALEVAAKAPGLPPLSEGQVSKVVAIDYGLQPVTGSAVVVPHVPEAFSLKRQDAAVGDVLVHFPKLGFRLDPV